MNRHQLQNVTDDEIIRMIREEGKDLFGILFSRYERKVRGKCYSLVKNSSLVEDLVQDIFIKALEKLPGFKGTAAFSTWLYSITYNHCIEYLRQNKRIRYEHWEEHIDLPDEVEDSEIEEILQMQGRVVLLLEMLKPEDKSLLIMKYQEGMRVKTIMELLKMRMKGPPR